MMVNVTEIESNKKEEKFSHIKRSKTVKPDITEAQEISNSLSCLMTCMK